MFADQISSFASNRWVFCKWILQQVLIRSLQFCAGYLALYIVFNICYFQDSKSVFLLFISLVEVCHYLFPLWSVETWKAVSPLTATFLIDVLCIFSTIRGTSFLQIPTPAIHDASRLASRILLSFFIHSTNSTMPHLLLNSCLSMMHSFLICIDSIESEQLWIIVSQHSLIATRWSCATSIDQDFGCTRCPAEEAVDCRIAAKGSFLPCGHFD